MKKPFTLERYMVVRDLRFSLLVLLLSWLPLSGEKKMEMAPFDLMRERGRGVATRTKSRCVVVANRDKV